MNCRKEICIRMPKSWKSSHFTVLLQKHDLATSVYNRIVTQLQHSRVPRDDDGYFELNNLVNIWSTAWMRVKYIVCWLQMECGGFLRRGVSVKARVLLCLCIKWLYERDYIVQNHWWKLMSARIDMKGLFTSIIIMRSFASMIFLLSKLHRISVLLSTLQG